MFGFSKRLLPPARQGYMHHLPQPKAVTVVGGGLAGLAAATILAERGAAVTLLEKEVVLGGRVGAWTDRLASGEPFEMERGFHAFFRQYYNVRSLLRRIDPPLRQLLPLVDYPILGPGGAVQSFERLPILPPFNVATLVWRTRVLGWRDLLRTDKNAALAMMRYDAARTYGHYDGRTARDYLDSLGFPLHARRMLFDVFSHSFFNPEDQMSAGEMLMMFHFYFLGNPEGLVFDVLCEPFSDALWRPFARYLNGLGATIRTGAAAKAIEQAEDGRWRVTLESGEAAVESEALVLALSVPALQQIVRASPALGDAAWRQAIDGLSLTLPFAVWRVWLDRPVRPNRQPFAGTAGLGIIDNISIYETFEGESRRHFLRTGGSVVELHAYAVPPTMDESAIKADLLARLHELYPETRDARILEERFLLRQDCPAFAPGSFAARPTVETSMPTVTLAGDFVRVPLPSALMERAVASGFLAANHLLANWNVRGEEIWSVPARGLFARFAPRALPLLTN
jgi:isorenieratene synthase